MDAHESSLTESHERATDGILATQTCVAFVFLSARIVSSRIIIVRGKSKWNFPPHNFTS